MYDVFISHSHRDTRRAQALAAQLADWGIDVYVDFQDYQLSALPDDELANHLVSALRECRLLIFAFSAASASSRWMPWELGLAHGVIGRVLLWPFNERALQAKATQEYLHLYEAIDPSNARERLDEILTEARASSIRPADLRAMEDLAGITLAKVPEFKDPSVATEFVTGGPLELYSAWLGRLIGRK